MVLLLLNHLLTDIAARPGEAGPQSGLIRRPRSNARETAELWARFREIEGTTHTFQREVRGTVTQIQQDICRIKEDQDTGTKYILDKVLAVEQGLQSQVDSVRKQTQEISDAMSMVVDRVSSLPNEMRNVMDNWGTTRFGALRGTPTTVSGQDMHMMQGNINDWIRRQQHDHPNNKPDPEPECERQTPSPTFDMNRWVNLPSTQPKVESNESSGHDQIMDDSGTKEEMGRAEVVVKLEAVEGAMCDENLDSNPGEYQGMPMQLDGQGADNMEVDDPVQQTARPGPVINLIGATPTGSQHSIPAAREVGIEGSGSADLAEARNTSEKQQPAAQDNPMPGHIAGGSSAESSTSEIGQAQEHASNAKPATGVDELRRVSTPIGTSANSRDQPLVRQDLPVNGGQEHVAPTVEQSDSLMETDVTESRAPAPIDSNQAASVPVASQTETASTPTAPVLSCSESIGEVTPLPSSHNASIPAPSMETIVSYKSGSTPVDSASVPASSIESTGEQVPLTQSSIESTKSLSAMEPTALPSQPTTFDNAAPPAEQNVSRISTTPANAATSAIEGSTASHLEVPARPMPVSRDGPITRSRSRSASRSLPPVVDGNKGQSSPKKSNRGRKPPSKRT
jgi:hypothetical protein